MSEATYRWTCDCGDVLEAETASEIGRKYHEHMRAGNSVTMSDKTQITILSRIDSKSEKSIEVEEPYGIIKDETYTGDYYLVVWPDEEEP